MTDTNLTGTYSANYTAQGLNENGGYIQQATLALFKFSKKTFKGTIHLYRAGAPAYRVITVSGDYILQKNEELKAIDGIVHVGIKPTPDQDPVLYQRLYVVRRKKEEFDFILIESLPVTQLERVATEGTHDPSDLSFPLPQNPPNGIIQGTFKRCDSL